MITLYELVDSTKKELMSILKNNNIKIKGISYMRKAEMIQAIVNTDWFKKQSEEYKLINKNDQLTDEINNLIDELDEYTLETDNIALENEILELQLKSII
jgi:hypothetical protein